MISGRFLMQRIINIVQEFDISSEKFAEQFSLLYEVNSDKIESLALYGNEAG